MEYKARQHLHAASDLDAGQAIYEPTTENKQHKTNYLHPQLLRI